ncbi:hypothetical protein BB8028_0007g00030 [Beauveria bassiana]|uniref:Uncharacterized protein n=1 Tax=Beauveria bassiana TaxID=176275 RepID=A0A2S7YLH8_BEABA|nr:hypothetical protein BB8028_0007g00030 [Beauveria bassiana]
MEAALEVLRLHEMYQTLLLDLSDAQRKKESLQRSLTEAQDQLDEVSMDREILEREIDLQKDALVEKTEYIRVQDFTMMEAQRQLQSLAALNDARGQVILALNRCIHCPSPHEVVLENGGARKRKAEEAGL